MNIGHRIKELRESTGETRTQTAARAGVSEHDMWRFESNRNVPNVNTLASLAQALGTSIDYLVTGQEPASVR